MTGDAPFTNPERAERELASLRGIEGGAPALDRVTESADPDMALTNLMRFLDAAGKLPSDLPAAVTLFAGSQSMSEAAIRDPARLESLLTDRRLPSRVELVERARAEAGSGGDDPRRALRGFVRRETLRLLLDDLTGRAELPRVAETLSDIADAAIDAALAVALAEARARYGTPRDQDGGEATLTVIGMGKLGGGELNYSSDIDLIFLYSAEGKTDAEDPAKARRNRDFFDRVVERTRHLLADQTEDGHCYRVDLRLRPEGSTGALTRSVGSALEYYGRKGRAWERQALIKARAVAGDRELGDAAFLEPVSGFVYGSPLTVANIRSIKELKQQMERRDRDPRQVKGGPGGIRDVEFTVQFLQLLHGSRHPPVRAAGTLDALRRLTAEGALTTGEEDALRESYVFLRTVEHRLQTVHEVRTHLLPADDGGLRRLALRMGYGGEGRDPLKVFGALHAHHTGAARGILERLFHNLFLERSPAVARFSEFVFHPDANEEPILAWLGANGFQEPEAATALLRRLADSPNPRARKFLSSLAPSLVLRASETPEPDRCLRNLESVVAALGAPTTFYQLLTEYEDILGVFTDVCGWSQHLSDLLVRNPSMIDAFADSLVVSHRGGPAPQDDLPLDTLAEEEDPAAVLKDLKDLSLLRIGVRDIQRKANTENTAKDLTALAERVLSLAVDRVRLDLTKRFGPPEEGATARFAVLALGKLGAREMSYASDLDLVFVTDAKGRTTGGAEISEVFEKLAQGVLRLLTVPGPAGRIYEVDPRARPYGRSGPILTPVASFERYYAESAHVAELQMLTKARAVAGDRDLGAETEEIARRVLYGEPPRPDIVGRALEMRERLERATTGLDVKRGFGGIVDIEFLAECLRLLHGHALPSLRTPETLGALAAATREGLLERREHETLLTAIQFLRSVESRMRIVYDMAQARIPDSPAERNRLARRLGYIDSEAAPAGDALLDEYEYHAARTRELFTEILTRQE